METTILILVVLAFAAAPILCIMIFDLIKSFNKVGRFVLIIKINKFLLRFIKKGSNIYLFLSYQIVIAYGHIDQERARLLIAEIAKPFFNKEYSVTKITNKYRADIVLKILYMYGIYLQSYKQYELSHRAYMEALQIATIFNYNNEIKANILPRIAWDIIDGNLGGICSADIFLTEAINLTSDMGFKLNLYIDKIKLQMCLNGVGNVHRAISDILIFMHNHDIDKDKKNSIYSEEIKKLNELLSSIKY